MYQGPFTYKWSLVVSFKAMTPVARLAPVNSSVDHLSNHLLNRFVMIFGVLELGHTKLLGLFKFNGVQIDTDDP